MKTFLDALKDAPDFQTQIREPLNILDNLCRDIELFTHGKVTCQRRLHNLSAATYYGQEWRIVLHSMSNNTEHILFRVYISSSGYPIRIDFYDQELTICEDVTTMHQQLLQFIERPEVVDVIRTVAG